MERLNGISVFVEVADAGGFSAAAERLNLTRSAVGKTVARLEQRLGVRLFHRTTRTQSLTDEGQLFYRSCLKALDEVRNAEALLESGKQEIRGRLRISMPVLFGRLCVAPLLHDLLRAHPRLEFDLSFNDRVVDLLDEGFDLAIRNGSAGTDPGLMARAIADQRMTVCAAPAYLEAHGIPTSLDDLTMHDAVVYARSGHQRPWSFPVKGNATEDVTPKTRLRLDDLAAIADAAADGLGLAWLPCWLVRERVQRGELVRVLTDRPGQTFKAYAVWPQTQLMLPKLRVVIDKLAERLPRIME
ncbi:DNA-binding transcriptional LysR family regulator [Sinorhizobium terangae]|uniref:LysR family transcriptional regulator n=1 Tax=Sinorhizobium terangae TaxID=110322 RepID=A0A6N7LEW2_SINTE|nr:LysR family transcriptional regulator [Sinorhizobium terangae]MBB4188260.1 DNA-binding transcriptional LysR family regulator [Sinorhizobium terangae]MQX16126.1 LysR family transcriptional regulator [Sinorhizobium terangae]